MGHRNGTRRDDFAPPLFSAYNLPAPGVFGRLITRDDDARGLWMDNGYDWTSFLPVLRVRDFRARAGGTSDVTPALVNAAAAAPSGGAVLEFDAGTYLINSQTSVQGTLIAVSIPTKPLVLRGQGHATIIQQGAGITSGGLFGFGNPSNAGGTSGYTTISGYTFNSAVRGAVSITTAVAADAGNFAVGDIIWLQGVTQYVSHEINRVLSANAATGVIELYYQLSKDFTGGTRLVKNVNSITARGITVENMRFQYSTAQAIMGSQIVGFKVKNCWFEGSGGGAAPMQINAVRNLEYSDNDFSWYGTVSGGGLNPSHSTIDARILNNRIRADSTAIGVSEGAVNHKVSGNQIYVIGSRTGNPISLGGATDVDIHDNTINYTAFDTNYAAIDDANGGVGSGINIHDNTINMYGTLGLYAVKASSPGTTVHHNQISAVKSGVWVLGAECAVTDNNILNVGNAVNGILVEGAVHSQRIRGNTVKGAAAGRGASGIRVSDNGAQTVSPIITENKIENFATGIVVTSYANDATVIVRDNQTPDCTAGYSPITLPIGTYLGATTITDGITAPTAIAGLAKIFVDTADGDLKIIYGDNVTKVIVADT